MAKTIFSVAPPLPPLPDPKPFAVVQIENDTEGSKVFAVAPPGSLESTKVYGIAPAASLPQPKVYGVPPAAIMLSSKIYEVAPVQNNN